MDMEYPGAASALKCAVFWKERLEKDRLPGDGFERGEMLLAQWRLFLAFVERLADVPEMHLFAVKQFVFSSALASYLGAGAARSPRTRTSCFSSDAAARASGTTKGPSSISSGPTGRRGTTRGSSRSWPTATRW